MKKEKFTRIIMRYNDYIDNINEITVLLKKSVNKE